MKKLSLALTMLVALGAGSAFAADAPAKADCSSLDAAAAAAKKAISEVPKVDLSSCQDKKAAEKADCEKPLNEKHAADVKAAALKFKDADQAAKCCKDPKAKGCATPAK